MKTPICDLPWSVVDHEFGKGYGPYLIAAVPPADRRMDSEGSGCCLTVGDVGLGYCAVPSLRDPITREQVKKAYRLMALAPDHALLASFFAAAVIVWEAVPTCPGQGELVFNGMRHATELDEFGVPRLTDHLRSALREYRDRWPVLLGRIMNSVFPPNEASASTPPASPTQPATPPAAARPVPGYPPASRLGPDALGTHIDVRA